MELVYCLQSSCCFLPCDIHILNSYAWYFKFVPVLSCPVAFVIVSISNIIHLICCSFFFILSEFRLQLFITKSMINPVHHWKTLAQLSCYLHFGSLVWFHISSWFTKSREMKSVGFGTNLYSDSWNSLWRVLRSICSSISGVSLLLYQVHLFYYMRFTVPNALFLWYIRCFLFFLQD